jgi:hypothetical protein
LPHSTSDKKVLMPLASCAKKCFSSCQAHATAKDAQCSGMSSDGTCPGLSVVVEVLPGNRTRRGKFSGTTLLSSGCGSITGSAFLAPVAESPRLRSRQLFAEQTDDPRAQGRHHLRPM